MAKKAYLAIDLGAESGRAIVGVLDHGRLTLHELHRFMHLPRHLPSGLHWDLTGLWGQILEGVRKSAEWARDEGVELVSLGVDTWGVDCGYVGRSGELLALPRAYRDARNGPAYEKLLGAVGEQYVYEQTGIQFMSLNTIAQVYAQLQSEPCVLENCERMLFIPDILHYFFTGAMTVEATIASTSQMIDPRTGNWATELLGRLGIPTHMLGKIIQPGATVGTLRDQVASETGAPRGLKVIAPATHDTAAAIASVPVEPGESWCYLSSGTWSLMGAELDEPCLTDAARAVPFTNEGGIGGTIRFLKNISGLWLVQETRRHYEKQGITYDYAKLTDMAADAEPFRTLIDTNYAPLAAPGDMPLKIAEFARKTNQPEPTEVGQVVRCCLESLALTYRLTLEKLEEVLGKRFDVLHIVGGGGKNRLLNQMTADALNRKVVVGPYEATAAGNLLVQAMGAGDVKDLAHIRQVVRDSFDPETFEPADAALWDKAYERFTSVLGKG
ncbi:MAG: rhamnulokinase [Phycisphaera sp.]|nr:rhamnulokinase [Phycisphaera sp.]